MSNALSIFNHSAVYKRPGLLGRNVFDDVFGSYFDDWKPLQNRTTQGYPVCDLYRNEDGSTVMEFALAGFQKSDLTIEVKPEKRSITVSAQAEGENETGRRIARRSFSKTYVNYDDNLDLSEAQAKFEDGLLTVTVPTRPEVKPLSIEIG